MNCIQIFHPEETLTYKIKRGILKVILLEKEYVLILDIASTEEIDDNLPDDALQCHFYQVRFLIEDFPIKVQTTQELIGKTINIYKRTQEIIDEDSQTETMHYSIVSSEKGDFQIIKNKLSFSKDLKKDTIVLKWIGECEDFTEKSNKKLTFKITYQFPY